MLRLSKKAKIIKNLVAINASFLFIFAAVNSVASVQKILNQEQNLGITSQNVLFATQVLTSLVIPSIVFDQIGYKWSMVVAELFFLSYIGFQAYPKWYTFIPTSILSGLAQSLVWSILGIYVTLLAKSYSKLQNMPFVQVQTLFFGVSGSIFLTSYTVGSLLVGAIIKTNKDLNYNETQNYTYDYSAHCGANNCPSTLLPPSDSIPDKDSVYWLCGSMDLLVIISLLISLFLMDNIRDNENDDDLIMKPSIIQQFKNEFMNMIRLSTNIDIWLLLPITLYTGFELTLIWFEFNTAFAACLGGINSIGWTNAFFGVLGCFLSFLMGFTLKYIGSSNGIILMLCASLTQAIFIISWTPSVENVYVIYLMIIGFSVSESMGTGQVRGLYGIFIPNNRTAFNFAAINQTFGLFLGSLFSAYLCTNVKIYIFIGIILLSLICYIILLIRHSKLDDSQADGYKPNNNRGKIYDSTLESNTKSSVFKI